MALFIVVKTINRSKLININYGSILETFIGSIGELFNISGKGEDDQNYLF
jgi:hypothetical protein